MEFGGVFSFDSASWTLYFSMWNENEVWFKCDHIQNKLNLWKHFEETKKKNGKNIFSESHYFAIWKHPFSGEFFCVQKTASALTITFNRMHDGRFDSASSIKRALYWIPINAYAWMNLMNEMIELRLIAIIRTPMALLEKPKARWLLIAWFAFIW